MLQCSGFGCRAGSTPALAQLLRYALFRRMNALVKHLTTEEIDDGSCAFRRFLA
jgi:hypothetical protein